MKLDGMKVECVVKKIQDTTMLNKDGDEVAVQNLILEETGVSESRKSFRLVVSSFLGIEETVGKRYFVSIGAASMSIDESIEVAIGKKAQKKAKKELKA